MAKLSEIQITEIHSLKTELSHKQIADTYNVSRSLIGKILSNKLHKSTPIDKEPDDVIEPVVVFESTPIDKKPVDSNDNVMLLLNEIKGLNDILIKKNKIIDDLERNNLSDSQVENHPFCINLKKLINECYVKIEKLTISNRNLERKLNEKDKLIKKSSQNEKDKSIESH